MTILLGAPTIELLARVVERHPRSSPESALFALQPQGTRPPFFCVHGVGGTVVSFQRLANHFELDQPFYGIRAVGAPGFENPVTRIEDMAACYLHDVRSVQPHGPYYLGGFSFGGSMALEMAQQLCQAGERVALLAILDHTPPPLRYRRFS